MTDSSHFHSAYARLNEAQKRVVDSLYGSFMVVAWPGTGKTQVLSARTAKILMDTDTKPENICITTFTEAGVTAIKKRLADFIGNASYQVHVSTLHALAKEMIESYPEYFLAYRAMSQMDDLECYEYIENIISPETHPKLCPLYQPTYWIRAIVQNIKTLRKEALSPEAFGEHIQTLKRDYSNALDEIDTKLKKYAVTKEKFDTHIARLLELKDIYEAYEIRKQREGKYDFDDMILYAAEELNKNDILASEMAEKYQFIMVDEFQDLSNWQSALVEGLLRMSEHPNILTVGDDDQSIYRFQGANLENMLHFSQKYPETAIIVLSQNYRSGQAILDTASELISHNTTRLSRLIPSITKPLQSIGKAPVPPRIIGYADAATEKALVLERIQEQLAQGTPPEEIAVIVRTNAEVYAWSQMLESASIHADSRDKYNAFESDEFRLLRYVLLVTVQAKVSNFELIELLRTGLFIDDRIGLYRITAKLEDINRQLPRKLGIFDLLLDDTTLESIVWSRFEEWKQARENLLEIRSYDQATPFVSIQKIESILKIGDFILKKSGIAGLERLYRVYEYIRESVQIGKFTTLASILDYWTRMQNYGIALNIVTQSGNTAGVQVLTAHQSKGLEYEWVFIPGLLDKNWGNRTNRDLLPLPQSITGGTLEKADQNEEERRLFFVAITRAKHILEISAPESDNGKPKVFSEFLSELPHRPESCPQKLSSDFLLRAHTPIFQLQIEEADLNYMEAFLKNYRLSASDLNRFLKDPADFLQKSILRYPFEDVPALIFGNCYHAALEQFFALWKKTNTFPDASTLYGFFEKKVYTQFLSPEHVRDFLNRGKTGLFGWHALQNPEDSLPLAIEYSTAKLNLVYKGIPIKGRVDRIDEIRPGVLRITDYKTGTQKSENELKGNTQTGDASYFRQLLFYKKMLLSDPKWESYEIGELCISYVDGKEEGKYPTITFTVTPEEEQAFEEELLVAWNSLASIAWWQTFFQSAPTLALE